MIQKLSLNLPLFLGLVLLSLLVSSLSAESKAKPEPVYEETFSDTTNPTNWRIVRQDTDDVINELAIRGDEPGYLDLRMESRFDYMIASDLTALPEAPYVIETRMRLLDADPRHAGGLVIGADFGGSAICPTNDYSTCFNQYYRFMFVAGNTPTQLELRVKRVEEHTGENIGSGPELGSATIDLETLGLTNSDWIELQLSVSEDGRMRVMHGETIILTVDDKTYQSNRYFGFLSATSDSTFSNTQVDWVRVSALTVPTDDPNRTLYLPRVQYDESMGAICVDEDVETNNISASALAQGSICMNKTIQGQIDLDDVDIYYLPIEAGQDLKMTLDSLSQDNSFIFTLYDSSGEARAHNPGGEQVKIVERGAGELGPGDYFIFVGFKDDPGPYTLLVE